MAPIPLHQGRTDRRRVGPFWIEEGLGLLAVGAGILAITSVLYILAAFSPA